MAIEPTKDPRCDCDDSQPTCTPFQLTNESECLAASLVNEHLTIGSAIVNVFKILGIYEQGKLFDLTNDGAGISNGEFAEFPAANAFDNLPTEWRSVQRGKAIENQSFIGYDFGPIKLDNGRLRYGIDTSIRHHITYIGIKQGCEEKNRVSRIRIERSDDNKKWLGVDIVTLANTEERVYVKIKQSTASRYWRIRAINFLGTDEDRWIVKELDLAEFGATTFKDVQADYGFLENRDRQYSQQANTIKGFYEIINPLTEFTRFGIDMSNQATYNLKIGFDTTVRVLGRPIVIGDIIELPSEIQYTPDLQPVRKFLEVTDVGWASEGFTPGWKPTILRVVAKPMFASEETMDIIGSLNSPSTDNDFFNLNNPEFDDANMKIDAIIKSTADTLVPERGIDTADIHIFSQDEINAAAEKGVNIRKIMPNDNGIYTADALPPNGEPYTEGTSWPQNPKDGAYHRLTYENTFKGGPIPPRLYKWSVSKNTWVFLEEDERMRLNSNPTAHYSLLTDPNRVNVRDL